MRPQSGKIRIDHVASVLDMDEEIIAVKLFSVLDSSLVGRVRLLTRALVSVNPEFRALTDTKSELASFVVSQRPSSISLHVDSIAASVLEIRGIAVEIEDMRSITLVGSIVGAIDGRGSKNAKSVGDGVGCRLVKVASILIL